MASRIDNQHIFGRVQADSVKLSGAPAPMGQWVQTTAPLLGGTLGGTPINEVRYTVIGKTCIATFLLSQSSAGTASGNLRIFLPIAARRVQDLNGHGTLLTTAGDCIVSTIGTISGTAVLLYATTNGAGPSIISDTVFGLDDNALWTLQFTLTYEIA